MNKYHKISQWSHLLKRVSHIARFEGMTDDNEPIYNNNTLPVIEFHGTVKLHGTNAGIEYNNGVVSFQSRSNKVTSGHFGFTQIPQEEIDNLVRLIKVDFNLRDDSHFVIFGEWAGQGIQKGIAISQLPKKFYIFDILLVNIGDIKDNFDLLQGNGTYLNLDRPNYTTNMLPKDGSISIITKYWSCGVKIDFEKFKDSSPIIEDLVNQVEQSCPVAKYYGIDGVGEGIVFKGYFKGERLVFKAKGDKHKVCKKNKIEIDPIKQKNIDNFVENYVTTERIKQAIFELKIKYPLQKDTGRIVKWVKQDIFEEENDTLSELSLMESDINSSIGKYIYKVYIDFINLEPC